MKKNCFMMILVGAVLFSCTKSNVDASASVPEWLNDFPPEDVLWGIGIAKENSPQMSMTIAATRGRVAIARQLDTKVFTNYTDDNDNTSTQQTNMIVSGAKTIKRWEAPDGTWWCLVELKKSDAQFASFDNTTVPEN